jgi:hypothetical protein
VAKTSGKGNGPLPRRLQSDLSRLHASARTRLLREKRRESLRERVRQIDYMNRQWEIFVEHNRVPGGTLTHVARTERERGLQEQVRELLLVHAARRR